MVSFGRGNATHWRHYCGGAIISDSAIVSAAHCFFKNKHGYKRATKIRMGDGNHTDTADDDTLQIHEVNTIIRHHNYGSRTTFDVAIVHTKQKIRFNQNIKPLCVPTQSNSTIDKYFNHPVSLAGWGLDETGQASQNLRSTSLKIYARSNCTSLYPYGKHLGNLLLCAGNQVTNLKNIYLYAKDM